MLKFAKSKIALLTVALILTVPSTSVFAGVRSGVSVSRPSVSVSRTSVPSFTQPHVSAPVQPTRPVVINRTSTTAHVSSGGSNSGGSSSSFMRDVAASAVGSAVGAGIVNYAMKPSTATTATGAPAQQAQQIPTLKPWEVIVDCNNLTYKVLDICRGRSTQ